MQRNCIRCVGCLMIVAPIVCNVIWCGRHCTLTDRQIHQIHFIECGIFIVCVCVSARVDIFLGSSIHFECLNSFFSDCRTKIKSLIWWEFLSLLKHSLIFVRFSLSSAAVLNSLSICCVCFRSEIRRSLIRCCHPCHTFDAEFRLTHSFFAVAVPFLFISIDLFSIEMLRLYSTCIKTHSFAYVLHSQYDECVCVCRWGFLICSCCKTSQSTFITIFETRSINSLIAASTYTHAALS